jgi:hypothetical protein
MWDMDSYQEFLREHANGHHAIGSALALLVVIGLLCLLLA